MALSDHPNTPPQARPPHHLPEVPRYRRTQHLDDLVDDVDRLVTLVAAADVHTARRLAADRSEAAVVSSLALDGAPITDLVAGVSTWLDTLHAPAPLPQRADDADGESGADVSIDDSTPESTVAVLEANGVAAALASTDLVEKILTAPVATLRELHRRITRGLVAADRGGADRSLDQAVHDGASGRIIFRAPSPTTVATGLAELDRWIVDAVARGEHPLIVSGVLHLEVLSLHPFDAANGRVARAGAHLALRAGGIDPHGLTCPEPWLAADALGYHEEVASSRHRRDAAIWLERWGEAVSDGLRDAARALGVLPTAEVTSRSLRSLRSLDDLFTVRDHRDATGLSAAEARTELRGLLDAGLIERVTATRGLRFRVTAGDADHQPS